MIDFSGLGEFFDSRVKKNCLDLCRNF